MELSHLVHALGVVGGRAFRSPALHFLVAGGLLFVALGRQGRSDASQRTRLAVPRYRIELARGQFHEINRRPPTPAEAKELVENLVDEEILYQYALRIGLEKEPVVERRLAQIAAFVEQNPHEVKSQGDLARDARGLGLDQGDPVVRRVLIDGAKRLIRAAVRVRAPTEEMLETYLRENPDPFMVPVRTRITQVTINRLAHGQATDERARAVLKKLVAGTYPPEAAPALGDKAFAPASLPLLTDRDLERRFGYGFVEALSAASVGQWSGPVPSRYGLHVVYVHERTRPYLPPLSEIRAQVRRRLVDELADEWLAFRLQELRAEFDVAVPDPST